jgi:hypothetical protein
MFGEWLEDLEELEAISQDTEARAIFSRMAAMSQEGRLESFLLELAGTPELDEFTKGTLSEIAKDEAFLLTVDDYLHRTQVCTSASAQSHPPLRHALPQLTNAWIERKSGRSWIRTTDLRLIRAAL